MTGLTVMIEALLIGGPCDGVRMQVRQGQDVIDTVAPFVPDVVDYSLRFSALPVVFDSTPIERYHLVRFGLSDSYRKGEFALYLHQSINQDAFDVVQRLFMGYRKPNKDQNNDF